MNNKSKIQKFYDEEDYNKVNEALMILVSLVVKIRDQAMEDKDIEVAAMMNNALKKVNRKLGK